jgi:hypothetical protein
VNRFIAALTILAVAAPLGAQATKKNEGTKTAPPTKSAPVTKSAPATKTPAVTATKTAPATKTQPATASKAPAQAKTAAPAPSLSVVPSQTELKFGSRGETANLSARVLDSRTRRPVSQAPVVWRSAAPGVATVSPNGQVAAVSNGTTRLWAISGKDSTPVTVTVERRASRLGFAPERVYLDAIGSWQQFRVEIRDARNNPLDAGRDLPSCRLRDSYVASMAPNGRITARNNGLTWVLCQRGDLRDSLRVEVRQRAARAQIVRDRPEFVLKNVSDSLRLAMIAVDRLGEAIIDGWVTWVSHEPAIAHVDVSTGVVIGVSVGATTIVGRIDGIEDSVTVSVRDPIPPDVIAARARERVASRLPLPTGPFGPGAAGEFAAAPASGTGGGAAAAPAGPQLPLDSAVALQVIAPSRSPGPGDTVQVTAIARNYRNDLLTGRSFQWTIRDSSIASLLPDGRLIARDTGRVFVIGALGRLRDSAAVVIRVASATEVAANTSAPPPSLNRNAPPPGSGSARTSTGPRNPALVDSIIRAEVIGTSTLQSRVPRRSLALSPLVGMGERKIDDRADGDDTPALAVRGLVYGAQLDVALNRFFGLQGLFVAGNLSPTGNSVGLEQTMAELQGNLGIAVQPWLALKVGSTYRGFKRSVATDRWLTMRAGGELRLDFVGGAVRAIVGANYIPTVKIDTVSNRPDLGLGAAAGLEYRARLFTAGLRYEVERYDFPNPTPGVKHLEQFSTLKLRMGLLLGR